MTRRTVENITLVDADPDGIAQTQTPSGAGALTLNGALIASGSFTASDRVARKIVVVSAADESAHTFTVVGTNSAGQSQSETITGVNTATATGSKYFLTVSSVTISAAATGAVTVGTSAVSASRPVSINVSTESFAVTNFVVVSGTINYTIEHTCDDISLSSPVPTYIADATIASKTASFFSALATPVSASRLVINSYSSGATIRWNLVEVFSG